MQKMAKLLIGQNIYESIGMITGVLGAVMLSFYPEKLALAAWIVWLVSSISLFVFAKMNNMHRLMFLEVVFTLVNVSGIVNSAANF